jgi:hypothetical protein
MIKTPGEHIYEIADTAYATALELGLLQDRSDRDPHHPSGYRHGTNGRAAWERERLLAAGRQPRDWFLSDDEWDAAGN